MGYRLEQTSERTRKVKGKEKVIRAKHSHMICDTVSDLKDWIAQPAHEGNEWHTINQSGEELSLDYEDPWRGTHTWQEAIDLTNKGWGEGLAEIRNIKAELEKMIPARPDLSYEPEPVPMLDCGEEIDVGEFVSGSPDHWVDWQCEERPKAGKVIRIVYCATVSAGYGPQVIKRRGAVALALVDLLESYGYRTEVVLHYGCQEYDYEGKPEVHIITTLKQAGEPLELDRLCYWISHPSSLRRMAFRAMENMPQKLMNTYGRCRDLPKSYQREGDLMLGAAIGEVFSTEEAVRKLLAIAKDYIDIEVKP